MAQQHYDFSGIWHCRYWYENTKHDNREDTSEYDIAIERTPGGYAFHSLPSKDGSYIQGRFTLDGELATGTWLENASQSGEWNGLIYKGAFQLMIRKDKDQMEGLWVAAIYNNNNPKIASNRWEFARVDDETAARLSETGATA